MELENLSGLEIGKWVNCKMISPTEIIQYFKKRIEERDPSLNAFTYTKFDEAFKRAKELEDRIQNGENVGPFAGVPVALKDFLPSKKGWQNSHGGVKSLIQIDDADSEFCKAAEKLGAIPIGKTNAPAFGFSGACQNKLYGATRNPFNLEYTCGGSSGGTAAAVGDGLITFGEGGDAGGSIRIPSGWCNLFGFKPSLGTVPSYCRPDGWTATHPYCFNGCLTKTVEDSAVMLNEMAQFNPRDPISLPINSTKDFTQLMKRHIGGMRIGFTYDFDMYPVDPKVAEILDNVIYQIKSVGATVEHVDFDFKHSLEDIMFCWSWAISIDTALDLHMWKEQGLDLIKDHRDELPEEFIHYNEVAADANIFSFREFNEIRTDILDNFENVFEDYDLILSPTACCPPMKIEDEGRIKEVNGIKMDPNYSFIEFGETPMANFVGYPVASIPGGIIENNLPIGVQAIGKKYQDENVFALAYTLEQINPWSYDIPNYRKIK